MPHDDSAALLDIVNAFARVRELIGERTADDFLRDEMLREAVQYRLIIAGEAVKRLTPAFREAHPGIRWSAIAGLRDVLVHAYERVDYLEIWNIAAAHTPTVLDYVTPLLPRRDASD